MHSAKTLQLAWSSYL